MSGSNDARASYVINSWHDVAALLDGELRRSRDFTMDVPHMPTERRAALERELKHTRNACGCELGTIFFGASIVSYFVALMGESQAGLDKSSGG